MLQKTRGIVINYIKYRETSVIVKIYTEQYGLQAYIINSIRSKASKKSLALLQPLSLLELVVYHKKNGGISRLSEYRSACPFKTIPFDIKKSTVIIFISEWLSKIIAEDEPDHSGQFSFLFESIKEFDSLINNFENFHLQLMIKTALYLGFGIRSADNLLIEDNIVHSEIKHVCRMAIELGKLSYSHNTRLDNQTRKDMLDLLTAYYKSHIESFGDIKSANILKEVFRG
ncbi:MAG: DNA repair protein RecO (recombination protein O) [Cyclobacteriaceae bacterium]|jgi:DNA repair protein RecO (recombination protein O)